MHKRRSVRHFIKNKPVRKEHLLQILQAAMTAPSAVNMQPWHFILIRERATLDKLAKELPYAKMLADVPVAIVVCGDTNIKAGEVSFWIEDCSLASGCILLAAEALSLGAIWTAVHPYPERISVVRDLLKIPEHIIPLNVIPIGYPTDEDTFKDKFDKDKVHFEEFELES